jgi:hypothetical protein
MTRKRRRRSDSNNDDTRKNTSGGGGGDNNNKRLRPNSEGFNGGSVSGGNSSGGNGSGGNGSGGNGSGGNGSDGNGGRNEKRESRNCVPASPKLSAPEIRQSQQKTAITNFSSSELSYNGSDRLVFITNGEPITTVWKRILKKDKPWNQSDVRIFVGSALVATDNRTGYEVEEIVTELGNPECGLKRLREIINFPSTSCDAGLDDKVLSFQYVILPLLGLFTRTAIIECILEKYVHAIFMVVYINLVSIINNATHLYCNLFNNGLIFLGLISLW